MSSDELRSNLMSPTRLPTRRRSFVLTLCVLSGVPSLAAAEPDDRSESPYFVVTSDAAEADPLPLQESRAEIHIAGVIAHVRVSQVYRNRGERALEATYVFPGSTRAAVFGMRMQVGERTIEADVQEREAARETYEAAKEAGQTASLLEQERPNVFQMSVANILPGDRVEVQLDYTELLVPEDGVYELVYPAVVGPRYAGAKSTETWHRNPYLREGASEPYAFTLRAAISAGMPIHDLASPSHAIAPRFTGQSRAEVSLGARGDGNRDFILRYRLRGGHIQTGLLRFEETTGDEREKFFLLLVQPPARVSRDDVPAREYVFIVDVSGSMFGFPLAVSKRLMRDLLGGLRPIDRFNMLFFSGGSYQLSERSLIASEENVARALRVLDQTQAGGGTELLGALQAALAMPSEPGTARSFVAITDGYVTVEAESFRLVRENLGKASFFAFGIGTGVNRHLIEGLARAGLGEPFVVESEAAAPAQARRFRRMIESPLLTDIRIEFRGFDALDVEPPSLPDLRAERPLVVFGKYRGDGAGTVTVRARGADAPFARTLSAAEFAPDRGLRALRYLWARHRIAGLRDLESFGGPSQRRAIVDLGLRYHLMTEHTSFVAVDRVRRGPGGELVTVRQPLPLPGGVSRYAVDGVGELIILQGSTVDEVALGGGVLDESGVATDVRSAAVSARTVGAGNLEVGHRLQISDAGEAGAFTAPTLIRFGLSRDLEARLGSSLLSFDEDGAAPPDLTAGGKLQLLGRPRLAIGLLADTRLDFDDDTPQRSTWRFGLLADTLLLPRLELRANLAAAYLSQEADSRFGLAYAAELAGILGWRWVLFAGTSGLIADRSAIELEAGFTRVLVDDWLIGLSGKAGLTDAADDLGAGLFLRWQL
jgi:Ca-activated chloride channel family protein